MRIVGHRILSTVISRALGELLRQSALPGFLRFSVSVDSLE
jgi:hypothetical protein